MVEKILKFRPSRQMQKTFSRLKGHNQNRISWRDIFNMLKSLRRSGLESSVSGSPSPLLLAQMEILYGADIAHNN